MCKDEELISLTLNRREHIFAQYIPQCSKEYDKLYVIK